MILDFDIYTWDKDPDTGNPVRQRLSETDFGEMPATWVADVMSRVYRYNGQIPGATLDRHHVLVWKMTSALGLDQCARLRALTHDVAEIFLGDIVSPLKQELPKKLLDAYRATERHILMQFVPQVDWFATSWPIKLADAIVRDIERGWRDPADLLCAEAYELLNLYSNSTFVWNAIEEARNCKTSWLDAIRLESTEEL